MYILGCFRCLYSSYNTKRGENIYEKKRVLKRTSQGRVSGQLLLYITNYKLYFTQPDTIWEFTVWFTPNLFRCGFWIELDYPV